MPRRSRRASPRSRALRSRRASRRSRAKSPARRAVYRAEMGHTHQIRPIGTTEKYKVIGNVIDIPGLRVDLREIIENKDRPKLVGAYCFYSNETRWPNNYVKPDEKDVERMTQDVLHIMKTKLGLTDVTKETYEKVSNTLKSLLQLPN